MTNQEAWDKFVETGRVDYYLLSRGINIYAEGYVPRPQNQAMIPAGFLGGDGNESDGIGDRAEGYPVGRQ